MAGTVALSGTVKYPDGTPVNGRLVLSLAKSATNICSTPFKVVPSNKSTVVRVVNGSVQNGSVSFDTTDCLTPRIPYYVAMLDNSNNILFTDNWYFPDSTDSTVDIGTMAETEMSSAISVSLPKAVIQNPSGSQTITQPGGTTFTISGTFAVSAGTTFNGSTSGSTLLKAAAVASGVVTIPSATDTLVGKATTDTLSNKTLTAAGNTNNITLLNVQGPATIITGSGSSQTVYTYTLPGLTLKSTGGVKISWLLDHSTGTGNVTYTLSFGGTSFGSTTTTASGNFEASSILMNNGSTSSQTGVHLTYNSAFAWVGGISSSKDTTVNQAITLSITAANTEQVTPRFFMVELIQ
jgi:hypothetical protein